MAYGYYAKLCAWNTSSGNLNWMEGFGMMGVNSTDDPLTISFVDNGVWGNLIHSLYTYSRHRHTKLSKEGPLTGRINYIISS